MTYKSAALVEKELEVFKGGIRISGAPGVRGCDNVVQNVPTAKSVVELPPDEVEAGVQRANVR